MNRECPKRVILIRRLAAVLICGVTTSCSHHDVNTWDRWCEQISGVDLERKYNRWGGMFAVSFNADAIRSDFVERFNKYVVQDIATRHLGGAKTDDQVVQELARLKMIGVWRDGTQLHWTNVFMLKDAEAGEDHFQTVVTSVRAHLDKYRNRAGTWDETFCLWGTIDTVFNSLTIHGEYETATIQLRHTLKP